MFDIEHVYCQIEVLIIMDMKHLTSEVFININLTTRFLFVCQWRISRLLLTVCRLPASEANFKTLILRVKPNIFQLDLVPTQSFP